MATASTHENLGLASAVSCHGVAAWKTAVEQASPRLFSVVSIVTLTFNMIRRGTATADRGLPAHRSLNAGSSAAGITTVSGLIDSCRYASLTFPLRPATAARNKGCAYRHGNCIREPEFRHPDAVAQRRLMPVVGWTAAILQLSSASID